MIHVTAHALIRAKERLPGFQNMTDDQIRTALRTPNIIAAALFGATYVRLPSGHRIAIKDRCITTILPPDHFRRQVLREGLSRYGANGQLRKPKHLRAVTGA